MLEGRTVAVMLLQWPVMAAVSILGTHTQSSAARPLEQGCLQGACTRQRVGALTLHPGFGL